MPIGKSEQSDQGGRGASSGGPSPGARRFYLRTMSLLDEAGLAYLVGGGHALEHYTGIDRGTKDFDIFVRRADYERIAHALAAGGYETELAFPHWLGKVRCRHGYVDVIFNSGNGVTTVDDAWFQNATVGQVFGVSARMCPVEEIIWSKAFVMERERYDCADIMHLLLTCAGRLDWPRLVERFAQHWRVLFSYLCLFGFVYPGERARIPEWVMSRFMGLLEREMRTQPQAQRTCQGTLLSREQYLVDIQEWGFADVRHTEASMMTARDIVLWTDAINGAK